MSEKKKSTTISSSLRYPNNTLEQCLDKIKLLFSKNSTNACSSQAIILDLGFTSKNGSSDSLLASLKYYNLLQKMDIDKYKVADFVMDYCISGTLTKEIINEALHAVPINKKLFSTYDFGNLPSDNEIKSFVIKNCGYNIKQATTYIDIFRKNQNLYNEYNKIIENNQENKIAKEDSKQEEKDVNSVPLVTLKSSKSATINYPLSNNKNITIVLPEDIKEMNVDDLEDTKDILEFLINKINTQISKKS